MQNIKKIKNSLKASNKKQELNLATYMIINFENLNTNSNIKSAKLTKLQYLNTNLAAITSKAQIKFPLETISYESEQDLKNYISKQKEHNVSFCKVKNIFILRKKVFNLCKLDNVTVYQKMRQVFLRSIKLATLLNVWKKREV